MRRIAGDGFKQLVEQWVEQWVEQLVEQWVELWAPMVPPIVTPIVPPIVTPIVSPIVPPIVTPIVNMPVQTPENQAPNQPKGHTGMRDLQKQVPQRADTAGNPIERPRLAQEERPTEEGAGPAEAAKGAAKSALAKWAIGAIGGSALIGGATTYFTFFS